MPLLDVPMYNHHTMVAADRQSSQTSSTNTGEEVSIDKQVACEECPRWLKMTEVACEKTEVAVC